MPAMPGDRHTAELLRRWHAGDRAALEALVARELPWVEAHVRRRLGPLLRAKAETQDYVHDAMIDVLRYGPRFVTADRGRFRALLARIVENGLRDRHDWLRAERRAADRERPLTPSQALDLDRPGDSRARPSQQAIEEERQAWARLALEMLDDDDRRVLTLRHREELSFRDIAGRLGITEDAARMRVNRALPKLARKLVELRQGALPPDL